MQLAILFPLFNMPPSDIFLKSPNAALSIFRNITQYFQLACWGTGHTGLSRPIYKTHSTKFRQICFPQKTVFKKIKNINFTIYRLKSLDEVCI